MKWRLGDYPHLLHSDKGYTIFKTGCDVIKYYCIEPKKEFEAPSGYFAGPFDNSGDARNECERHYKRTQS